MRLSESVDLYLGSLEGRCLPSTVKRYNDELKDLLDFLGDKYPAEEVSMRDCESYLTMRWKKDKAQKTKAQRWTVLNQLFTFLDIRDYVPENPMRKIPYPKVPPAEDRGVKSMTAQDVQKMFAHCESWTEKLCIGVLAYMGVRRKAANNLRWKDVELEHGYMTFTEKGQKTIRKPIPLPLLELLKSYRSLSEGEWPSPAGASSGSLVNFGKTKNEKSTRQDSDSSSSPSLSDYVIPSDGPVKSDQRNDRFIWRVVKRVGERAGVDTHCHAFRAAFAVFYLESHDFDTIGLQELMGHNHFETTKGYLRRLNKEKAMERVRDLDWGVPLASHTSLSEEATGVLPAAVDSEGTGRGVPASHNPRGVPYHTPASSLKETEGVSLTEAETRPTPAEGRIVGARYDSASVSEDVSLMKPDVVSQSFATPKPKAAPAGNHGEASGFVSEDALSESVCSSDRHGSPGESWLREESSWGGTARELPGSLSAPDAISHIDDEISQKDSMTPTRLRGKDSNLDSEIPKASSENQTISKRERQKRHVSKTRAKKTT